MCYQSRRHAPGLVMDVRGLTTFEDGPVIQFLNATNTTQLETSAPLTDPFLYLSI